MVATRELLGGAAFSEIMEWVRLLLAFDLIFVSLGALLFGPLVSECVRLSVHGVRGRLIWMHRVGVHGAGLALAHVATPR